MRGGTVRGLAGVSKSGLRLGLMAWVLPACMLMHGGMRADTPNSGLFQTPTDAELKMTADPKAPGADAVILDEEIDKDIQEWSWFEHLRIKVLTEKGKELATVQTPFEADENGKFEAQARTIHPDGVMIPMTEAPKELMDFKTKGYERRSMVFNLPSVEVGSILEYWIRIRNGRTETDWQIQGRYFIHRASFSYRPSRYEGTMTSARIGTGQNVVLDPKGVFRLEITDVPPVPEEDWMPPLNTVRWAVNFYTTDFKSRKEFWDVSTKAWAEGVNEFTKPTGTLKKAVADLVGPGDTQTQKARKIYDAIEKLDNSSFSRVKSKAERKKEKLKDVKKAEDIWKQRSGSADGITLLYVAMARAAGLQVKAMQVVNRDRAVWDAGMLSTEQLDDFIAVVNLDGKEVMLDPGQKFCPFGSLHWKHTLAAGFEMGDKVAILSKTPAPTFKDSVVQKAAYLEINAGGDVSGTLRFAMFGPEALYWRQLSLSQDEDEVKKRFNEWVHALVPAGIETEFDHFLGIDDVEVPLIGVEKVNGKLAAATGKRFFVPGLFFEANAPHPFVALDERKMPIDVQYPRTDRDEVVYRLPVGYSLEGSAPTADVTWPGFAEMRVTGEVRNDAVTMKRELAYNFVLLDAKQYKDLHTFYQKVATADQQQLVLTRSAVVKGN